MDTIEALGLHNLFVREPTQSRRVDAHIHHIWQAWHCWQGELEVMLDGRSVVMRPGDTVLIAPGALRALNQRRGVGYLVAMMTAQGLDLRPAAGHILAAGEALAADWRVLVEEMRAPPRPDTDLLCRILLLRLLLGLRRQAVAARVDPPTHDRTQQVAQAESFMRRHLDQPLYRADIAAAVGISEPHLARIFSACTGTSLHRRLVELRVEHARLLLCTSSLTVSQIALVSGFGSFSHFSKVFREITGETPSGFRRRGKDERPQGTLCPVADQA